MIALGWDNLLFNKIKMRDVVTVPLVHFFIVKLLITDKLYYPTPF